MAKIHGVAGEWARTRGMVLGLWPLGLGIFAAGFSLALWVISWSWAWTLLLVSLGWIAWSAMKGFRRVENFFVGAIGEERVSSALKNLGPEWHVFNEYVALGTHIDHVVAGPSGLYVIETKFWNGAVTLEEGTIKVESRIPTRSPIKQVLGESARLKSHLAKLGWNGQISSILVFASNTFKSSPVREQGVAVLNLSDLSSFLESGASTIDALGVDRLAALMIG